MKNDPLQRQLDAMVEQTARNWKKSLTPAIEKMITAKHGALCMDDPRDRKKMAAWIARLVIMAVYLKRV